MLMKAVLLVSLSLAGVLGAPEPRFACHECVDEMHKLGWLIHAAADDIKTYLGANYCPTLEEDLQERCVEDLTGFYVHMLGAIVNHYFVDGAVHICQTMGVCDARSKSYTCEECVEGLEWVEMYMEDPIQVAEYAVYLMQNFCTSEHPHCPDVVAEHFPPMHWMAMEKFMIPTEICGQEPVCTGEEPTKPHTRPPMTSGPPPTNPPSSSGPPPTYPPSSSGPPPTNPPSSSGPPPTHPPSSSGPPPTNPPMTTGMPY